jgi:hypothetical protein
MCFGLLGLLGALVGVLLGCLGASSGSLVVHLCLGPAVQLIMCLRVFDELAAAFAMKSVVIVVASVWNCHFGP